MSAIQSLPSPDGEPPVFSEPWQAQAFALTVSLSRRGLFSWPQWAEALGAAIKAHPVGPDESHDAAYWRQWLTALETLVVAQGVASAGDLAHLADDWARAALLTPHGRPITLDVLKS